MAASPVDNVGIGNRIHPASNKDRNWILMALEKRRHIFKC